MDDQVRFVGFLSQAQLREQFYRSHIFLHPSELGGDGNQEGVPNAMLEAMASGLPVFATDHGGIPEAIEHGMSGVLVEERDHAALAEAMLDWTGRPEALAQLARRGAERSRKNSNSALRRAFLRIFISKRSGGHCRASAPLAPARDAPAGDAPVPTSVTAQTLKNAASCRAMTS